MNIKTKKAPLFNDDRELTDYLLKDFGKTIKVAIKMTVKVAVKEEMTKIREEMEDKLSFNGSYPRNMLTPMGKIEDIPVPRFREKPINELNLNSMNVFENQKENFLKIVSEMHRLGVSQRKVEQLCQTCFGVKINKNRVGKVHKELAKQEELQINNQVLNDNFKFLLLDGIWIKCKSYGWEDDNRAVLLCALGITSKGERKIIGFKFSKKEDYESWHELAANLKQRGLGGKNLKLIITDDNGALTKVLNHLFPKVKTQTCIVHKLRNVITKANYKDRKTLANDAKQIYMAKNKEEAIKRAKQFARIWYVKAEASTRSLRHNFLNTLTYYEFPESQWKKIRTTNILEREFREVRRRIKVFDNSFNNPESVNNYANTIFDYLNNHYPAALHNES